MRIVKLFIPVLLTIVPFLNLSAQNVNGRVSSSVYAFERASSLT